MVFVNLQAAFLSPTSWRSLLDFVGLLPQGVSVHQPIRYLEPDSPAGMIPYMLIVFLALDIMYVYGPADACGCRPISTVSSFLPFGGRPRRGGRGRVSCLLHKGVERRMGHGTSASMAMTPPSACKTPDPSPWGVRKGEEDKITGRNAMKRPRARQRFLKAGRVSKRRIARSGRGGGPELLTHPTPGHGPTKGGFGNTGVLGEASPRRPYTWLWIALHDPKDDTPGAPPCTGLTRVGQLKGSNRQAQWRVFRARRGTALARRLRCRPAAHGPRKDSATIPRCANLSPYPRAFGYDTGEPGKSANYMGGDGGARQSSCLHQETRALTRRRSCSIPASAGFYASTSNWLRARLVEARAARSSRLVSCATTSRARSAHGQHRLPHQATACAHGAWPRSITAGHDGRAARPTPRSSCRRSPSLSRMGGGLGPLQHGGDYLKFRWRA